MNYSRLVSVVIGCDDVILDYVGAEYDVCYGGRL